MLENNIYNIDKEFDYSTIKAIVVKSLEKLVKEQALEKRPNVPDDIISNCVSNGDIKNVGISMPASHLLKLKIRNTTKYLNWRLSVLRRDNFTCKICHTSVKENKSLRLEVHHSKAFDEICKENNVATMQQARVCNRLQ